MGIPDRKKQQRPLLSIADCMNEYHQLWNELRYRERFSGFEQSGAFIEGKPIRDMDHKEIMILIGERWSYIQAHASKEMVSRLFAGRPYERPVERKRLHSA